MQKLPRVLYPRDEIIKELIIKNYELDAILVLLDRRIHYTTITNLFFRAGIIAHVAAVHIPADCK